MNDDLHLLVTLYQAGSAPFTAGLVRCALTIRHGVNAFDMRYPREHDDRIAALLPAHVRSIGPIVNIEQIFDVATADAVPAHVAEILPLA